MLRSIFVALEHTDIALVNSILLAATDRRRIALSILGLPLDRSQKFPWFRKIPYSWL